MQVSEATFQQEVVERSKSTPVLVDFWAPWCQPCRVIGPILDRVVGEANGDVVLAKVNVDENPGLARAFGVQGIPAVKVFKDGEVVHEFTGVPPQAEQAVRAVVQAVTPSEADRLTADGTEEAFRKALEIDHDHAAATVGLARLLAARGDAEAEAEALELLGRVPETSEVAQLRAELELREVAPDADDVGAEALAEGDYEAALAAYLGQVQATKDDAAREAMVRVFTALGDDHPLVREFRPRLARALF